MTLTTRVLLMTATIACGALWARSQSPESLDLTAVGKDPRWKIAGRTASIVDIKGRHALKLSEAKGMGVVWLDGKVFLASSEGVVTVLADGETLKVLSNNDLGEPVFGTPALVGSAVYMRSLNNLWAFGSAKNPRRAKTPIVTIYHSPGGRQ